VGATLVLEARRVKLQDRVDGYVCDTSMKAAIRSHIKLYMPLVFIRDMRHVLERCSDREAIKSTKSNVD